jgi:uncharacterized protein (DUF58 family)
MHLTPPEPHYAGASRRLSVVLHNTRRSVRYGIGMAVRGSGQWAWTDVPAEGSATVQVAFQPERRGLHPCRRSPRRRAFRSAPSASGRCGGRPRRCWSIPAPEAHPPPLPPGEPRPAAAAAAARAQAAGEYDGVRAYRRGDPLKLVVWKKAARAQGHRTKIW